MKPIVARHGRHVAGLVWCAVILAAFWQVVADGGDRAELPYAGFDESAAIERAPGGVVLSAQSVPAAEFVPVLGPLLEYSPAAWEVIEAHISSAGSFAHLQSPLGADWRLEFSGACDPGDAERVPSLDFQDVTVYRWRSGPVRGSTTRTYYVFEGGCVASTLVLPDSEAANSLQYFAEFRDLVPRSEIAAEIEARTAGRLTLDP